MRSIDWIEALLKRRAYATRAARLRTTIILLNKAQIGSREMKRTTIFLGDADRSAIQAIKDRFGISSDSDAIRLALRVIAGVPNAEALLLPTSVTMADGREQAVGELSQAR